MKKIVAVVGLALGMSGLAARACAAPSTSQVIKRLDGSTISRAEIDLTVARLIRQAHVTGIAIAILVDGRIAYVKGYGHRNTEANLPLTEDTVMYAASFTKVAFACLVMQLVEERALDLDKPVYMYLPKPLPEYPNYSDLANDPRWKLITTRMLLSHTSGFPNWRRFTDDKKLSIMFQPGSKYSYSGEGIALLQLVVETITKRPLGDMMRDRVFRPYGMERTSMVWDARFEDNYAIGYDENGRSLGYQRRTRADAAGSMVTTVADFARFVQAVMEGRGLQRKTKELMLSPQIQIFSKSQFPIPSVETTDEYKPIRLSYGLGWGLFFTPYGKAFFKEGHDDGWENYALAFDDVKAGIVIMTNSSNGESIFKELLERLQGNTITPWKWEGFIPYNHPQ